VREVYLCQAFLHRKADNKIYLAPGPVQKRTPANFMFRNFTKNFAYTVVFITISAKQIGRFSAKLPQEID
jgi:hypothetical protein